MNSSLRGEDPLEYVHSREFIRKVDPMEAMARGDALEWGHTLDSSRKRFLGPLKIGAFLLGGIDPIHSLPLIDVGRQGVYLTFPEGTALVENDVFRVVRPLMRSDASILASGNPRVIVAEVKVLRVTENTRALVQVLTGSVIKGTGAEKLRGGPTP